MVLEYSGRHLAMIEAAAFLKKARSAVIAEVANHDRQLI